MPSNAARFGRAAAPTPTQSAGRPGQRPAQSAAARVAEPSVLSEFAADAYASATTSRVGIADEAEDDRGGEDHKNPDADAGFQLVRFGRRRQNAEAKQGGTVTEAKQAGKVTPGNIKRRRAQRPVAQRTDLCRDVEEARLQAKNCCHECTQRLGAVRYKCATCTDVFLCEACKSQGRHVDAKHVVSLFVDDAGTVPAGASASARAAQIDLTGEEAATVDASSSAGPTVSAVLAMATPAAVDGSTPIPPSTRVAASPRPAVTALIPDGSTSADHKSVAAVADTSDGQPAVSSGAVNAQSNILGLSPAPSVSSAAANSAPAGSSSPSVVAAADAPDGRSAVSAGTGNVQSASSGPSSAPSASPAGASSASAASSSLAVSAVVATADAHAATSAPTNLQPAVSSNSSATSVSPAGVIPPRDISLPLAAAAMANDDSASSSGTTNMQPAFSGPPSTPARGRGRGVHWTSKQIHANLTPGPGVTIMQGPQLNLDGVATRASSGGGGSGQVPSLLRGGSRSGRGRGHK